MKKFILVTICILLAGILSGCVFDMEPTIQTEDAIAAQNKQPTGQPKTIATALIVNPTATPTLWPTATWTPQPPTPTPTWTPFPNWTITTVKSSS